MSKTKIYFIGRKQGIGIRRFRISHLENRRRYEADGLRDANKSITQTRWMKEAEVIWVRVRPEHTTDKQRHIIEKRLKTIRNRILVINDINIFNNYDCKNLSFQIWKNNSLPCPQFIDISLKIASGDIKSTVKTISQFINQHRAIFLRTNNETASFGMYHLTKNSTENEIEIALKSLINRCQTLRKTRASTSIMATQFIMPDNKSNYQNLYRAHILFGKILSFYVVTSKKPIFHNIDMEYSDIHRFIELNESLCKTIPTLEKQILKATATLGCNLGAIEFFLIKGKPIFIELNPMWGGHASISGFGNNEMQTYLIENRSILENRIPNIYNFMDRRDYYCNLYKFINQHIKGSNPK